MSSPQSDPGREALVYHPSRVSWATARFVRQPPALAAVVGVYVFVLFLASGAIYSVFAKVPITIGAGGALVAAVKPMPIVSVTSSKVIALNVENNQEVKAGEVLLVTENMIETKTLASVKQDVARLRQFIALDKLRKCSATCGASLQAFAAVSFSQPLRGNAKELLVQMQDRTREYAASQLDVRNLPVILQELRRVILINQRKIETIKKQGAGKMLAVEIETLESNIGAAKAQIAERTQQKTLSNQSVRDRAETFTQAFLTRLDEFQSQQSVKAPANGLVTDLQVAGVGQQLSEGQMLMNLIHNDVGLIAEIEVKNQDIAKIHIGMPVKIKLDALSDREFGFAEGKIFEIPAKPTVTPQQSVYLVRVKLEKQAFERLGRRYPFKLGMTLSAKIISKKERLVKVLRDKIFRISESMAGNT